MKKLILAALIYSIAFPLFAINEGETRTANVSLETASSDNINIQAKNTELILETWDKNEILIEASVRFDGKMTDKMQKFLDDFEQQVKDGISTGAGEVKIDTDLDIPNRVQIGGKHVGINISYGDDKLKIQYKIKAPGTNDYVISNSYEDVKIFGRLDNVDFTQYSGKLEADDIGTAKLSLKYGSAKIKSIEEAELEIYEQKINISYLGKLDLNAKYSDLEFEEVKMMEATSYESDFEIGSGIQMKGNFKYGEIDISNKMNQAEFTFYEMKMDANEIGAIKLVNSKYSKFEFENVGNIEFEQSYEDETNIGTLGSFSSKNSKYGNHSIDRLEKKLILLAYEDEIEIDELGDQVESITLDGKYLDALFGISNSAFILSTSIKYGKADYDESDVEVRRYIKESDRLELELHSKVQSNNPTLISIKGYEVDFRID